MKQIHIDDRGYLTLTAAGTEQITPSPIGILCAGGAAYLPTHAQIDGTHITVTYPHGTVELCGEDKGGYYRLTLLHAPENTDGFLFGPYRTTAAPCVVMCRIPMWS